MIPRRSAEVFSTWLEKTKRFQTRHQNSRNVWVHWIQNRAHGTHNLLVQNPFDFRALNSLKIVGTAPHVSFLNAESGAIFHIDHILMLARFAPCYSGIV